MDRTDGLEDIICYCTPFAITAKKFLMQI